MKSLIQGQSIRFEAHKRGDGEPIEWGKGLHMHKIMNDNKYNGAEVLLYLDSTRELEFRKIQGREKIVKLHLRNEISNAFKKDKVKSKKLIQVIMSTISEYSVDLPLSERIENLRNGALRIAKSFDLKSKTKEDILKNTNDYIKSYTTYHKDEFEKEFFIIQDIEGNCIKIGDNLEILKNDEIKLKK